MFAEYKGKTVQRAQDCSRSFHLLSLCFTAILLVIILISINCKITSHSAFCQNYQRAFPITFLIAYLIYFCEYSLSKTKDYLPVNSEVTLEYEWYMRRIKRAAPLVGIGIQCYHYSYRIADEMDEVYEGCWLERRTTFSKRSYFDFSSWEDATGEVFGVMKKDFVLLEVVQTFDFGNEETAKKFEAFQQGLIDRYKERDEYIESSLFCYVEGHGSQVLVQKKRTERPFWLTLKWYWIFSFCLLSWPYRMWFESILGRKRIVLRKVIYS